MAKIQVTFIKITRQYKQVTVESDTFEGAQEQAKMLEKSYEYSEPITSYERESKAIYTPEEVNQMVTEGMVEAKIKHDKKHDKLVAPSVSIY